MDRFALAVEVLTALITVAGIVYGVIALLAARSFARRKTIVAEGAVVAPMSILKPLKGVEPSLYAGFVTHCLQDYAGEWEILFGVRSLADPAVALVARLRVEHPHINIRLVECPQELGANGKVSTLAQMLPHASYDILVVNDSDIAVPPNYLSELMRCFAEGNVGMVTALYRGRAAGGLWSRMEALGIATDFMPGVLTARRLEGGIHFGLGSTLAMTREALTAIGGFAALADLRTRCANQRCRLSRGACRRDSGNVRARV
jgi:ceramide glucosyltransferase